MTENRTTTETVRIDGVELLFELPSNAGQICGLCHYRGRLIITTDFGRVYEWDGEVKELRSVAYLP
jgi:hypothetical protein